MQNNYNSEEKFEVLPAGFFVRLAAFIIDTLIIGIVLIMAKMPVWLVGLFLTDPFWSRDILFTFSLMDIFSYVMTTLYFVLFTYFAGATIGKKLMNIEVVSSTGETLTKVQVLYRETIGRYLSVILSCLGYLLIFVDKKKRALHDVLADTEVVYAKRIKVKNYYKENETQTVPQYVTPVMNEEQGQEEKKEEIF